MKILKKLMILLVLAALIIGCSKEPENNYLGNLKVGYTMKLDDKEVPKAKFEFFYGDSSIILRTASAKMS